ncbi:MAG TPA: glycosyltransferase family 4 protein [Ornithinibacter sp.]|nr:glycosyltransferase family 4 protein [Ornithinibacter sp.]
MRIRYLLLNAYGQGGTIRTTLSMASVLAERGHDVEVASVLQTAEAPRMPVSPLVRVVSLTGRRPRPGRRVTPSSTLRWSVKVALRRADTRLGASSDRRATVMSRGTDVWVRRWVRAQEDAVVIGTRHSLVLALARSRTDRQVALGQEHNYMRSDPESRAAYAADYPSLDALAVLTEQDAATYRATFGERLPVHVVHNAVPHGWNPSPSPLTSTTALAAGALVPRKGFDLLVTAWAGVAREHPDWRLRVLGSGVQRAELEAAVDAAGLTDVVTFVGFTPDVAAEMAAASMFVLSSRAEGFPMVVLEAMAAGLPVVAFDCPTGPRELVDDEVTGLLVPRRDTAALAAAVSRVASDPDLRRRMGTAAAERARLFDAEAVATRWEQLFAELGDAKGLSLGR